MALIRCPECGRQVSDMAGSCPSCGYPITTPSATGGYVSIETNKYFPNTDTSSRFSRAMRSVKILGPNGNVLGEGRIGSVIHFHLDEPTRIFAYEGGYDYEPVPLGIVKPNGRYSLLMEKQSNLLGSEYLLYDLSNNDSEW